VSGRRLRLGDAGERLAERELSSRGWTILARKWRGSAGEVDLIADDGDMLVFVEVKTRRGESHGRAEESVRRSQCGRLLLLGEEFIQTHPEHDQRFWRVDLVAITIDHNGAVARTTHIENACLDE
jgi:putative endonuclease